MLGHRHHRGSNRKGCWQPQAPKSTTKYCKASPLLAWLYLLSLAPFGPPCATFGLSTEPSKPQTFPAHPRRSCLVSQVFFFSLLIVTRVCPLPQGHKSQPPPSVTFQVRFQLVSCWSILYPLLLLGFTSTHCIADVATAENDTALTVPDAQVGLLPNCSSCPPPPPNLL